MMNRIMMNMTKRKERIFKDIFFIVLVIGLTLPVYLVRAADGAGGSGSSFGNPLGTTSISCLVYKITEVVFKIGFLVAVMFIILSGLKFVTARGNEQQLEKAKKAFVWAVMGAALILGASIIIKAVIETLKSLGANGINLTGC